MKIKIQAHEITDADISKVSLVKRGANRIPFKIIKAEDEPSLFSQNLQKVQEAVMATLKKSRISKSTPPGSNFVAPSTRGEQQADTAAQQADRAQYAVERDLERRIALLGDEFRLLEKKPGIDEYARQRVLYDLHVEINGLKRVLADSKNPNVTKDEDALDRLFSTGETSTHRGGTSHHLDVDDQPRQSRLSKEEAEANRQFWADLANDLRGVRRQQPTPVAKSSEPPSLDDLSNPFGIRGR